MVSLAELHTSDKRVGNMRLRSDTERQCWITLKRKYSGASMPTCLGLSQLLALAAAPESASSLKDMVFSLLSVWARLAEGFGVVLLDVVEGALLLLSPSLLFLKVCLSVK